MLKYSEASDLVFNDIDEAFTLMEEEGCKYKYGDVDINKAVIVTGLHSELYVFDRVLDMPVVLCDLQSSYDYFLAMPDPNIWERVFLRCHRQAMEG